MLRCLLLFWMASFAHADTINHYMGIANNIPQMEMKADPQAQAWARSARTVLILTSESISETLMLANESAKAEGKPLFCIPAGTQLTPEAVNELIQTTYKELGSQQSDKDQMTVSQMALLGFKKKFPCPTQTASAQTGAWPDPRKINY